MMKKFTNVLFAQDHLIPVLGLCPLLVVTTSFINSLATGLIFWLALLMTSTAVSCMRHLIPHEVRYPVILILSATAVTVIHFAVQVYFYELSLLLGIYVPLIAVNCLLLFQADAHAIQNHVAASLIHSLKTGVSVLVVLSAIGALREIIGGGTMFKDIGLLLGENASVGQITLLNIVSGLTVFKSATGTFMMLGLVVALFNLVAGKPGEPEHS